MIANYLELVTSEHRNKPKFEAMLSAVVSAFVDQQSTLTSMPAKFDINTALGSQLDVLGLWIGRSRHVSVPLTDVYLTWDSLTINGWDSGTWQDLYDPSSGLVTLPDDSYRVLLKAVIASNNWDGTIPHAYSIWESVFGTSSIILIQDNQDMSMVVGLGGQPLGAVNQALLLEGSLSLKPTGVRVSYYAVAPTPGPLLLWDAVSGPGADGWDLGQWPVEIMP
jgi:hypothetical protein